MDFGKKWHFFLVFFGNFQTTEGIKHSKATFVKSLVQGRDPKITKNAFSVLRALGEISGFLQFEVF